MHVLMVHNEYAKPSGEEYAVRAIAGLLENHSHKVSWMLRSSAEMDGSFYKKLGAFLSGIYSLRSRSNMVERLQVDTFDMVQVQNLFPLLSPSILGPIGRRGIPVVMRCPNYRLFCPNGLHLSRGQVCERCLGGREWWCVLRNCEDNALKSFGYALRNAVARITGMIRNNVTVFIVLSEFQRRRFIAGGIEADRVCVVPNICPPISGDGRFGVGDTISFVGRVSEEKGIRDFVEAARAMPDHRFEVAGDASQMPQLVAEAPSNVRFRGFLSGRALDEFYHRTRVFVFPSVCFEGFPNVVAKAMSAGKPVVSTRIGALPEIVDEDTTGLLYAPGNVEELVQKVLLLVTHPELCAAMGEAGRRKATTQYSPDAAYESLMAAYGKATRIAASCRNGPLRALAR